MLIYEVIILWLHRKLSNQIMTTTASTLVINRIVCIVVEPCRDSSAAARRLGARRRLSHDRIYVHVGLYKIFFHFCVCVQESIKPLLIPPPICITHTTAVPLRDFCAIYELSPTLLLYAIHHTILVMTISCKG